MTRLLMLDCFAPPHGAHPFGQPCGLAIPLRGVPHTVTESPSTCRYYGAALVFKRVRTALWPM